LEPSGVSLGVVGWPVRHSLSPRMHAAALESLAAEDPSFRSWTYRAFELKPEDLPEAVRLFEAKGFRGINLTVPHKIEVLPLVDEIDPTAERMGAVNTLWFEAGRISGFNTDGYGLENAVREAFGAGLGGREVLILGSGGAARAAAVQCLEEKVAGLCIANRTLEKAQRIAASLNDPLVQTTSLEGAPGRVSAGTLVINSTSLGLKTEDGLPLVVQDLPEHCLLFDMIYNPSETAFLAEGRRRGYPVSNGLGMLVHQGARSLEIWTGKKIDASVMFAACVDALAG